MKIREITKPVLATAIALCLVLSYFEYHPLVYADSLPGGSMIATPTMTTGTNTLIFAEDLFTSETDLIWVFMGAGSVGWDPVPTRIDDNDFSSGPIWRWTAISTNTQTLDDSSTELLVRKPCREYVEVWNRTTATVYLLPNAGKKLDGTWNETTATLSKATALTKLGPYGGADLPISVLWTKANDPSLFPMWNVGVIIESDGTFDSAATVRSAFTSATMEFTIIGR